MSDNKNYPNPNLPIVLHYVVRAIQVLVCALGIWLGYKLFILGVTGQASLSMQSKAVDAQLLNAAPGIFFALAGFIGLVASIWRGSSVSIERESDSRFNVISKF